MDGVARREDKEIGPVVTDGDCEIGHCCCHLVRQRLVRRGFGSGHDGKKEERAHEDERDKGAHREASSAY